MTAGRTRGRVALFYAVLVLVGLALVAVHPKNRARVHLRYAFASSGKGISLRTSSVKEVPVIYEWVIEANALVVWVEKNRGKLPEQLR